MSNYYNIMAVKKRQPPLLLDLFPNASVAYSLRKLRTAYSGSAIRVRRSSDNTEQNIGFVGNNLDTASLLAFCGAGNGFVTTWYDQSGNANNATQATASQQCQIVSSGSVLTNPSTGKISTNWTGDFYQFNNINLTQTMLMSAVVRRALSNNFLIPLGKVGSSEPRLYGWLSGGNAVTILTESIIHESRTAIGNYILSVLRDNLNNVKAFRNTATLTSGVATLLSDSFNSFGQTSTLGTTGTMVEMLLWQNDKESLRTNIVTNQNNYWEVY
jgi:hypothetical protein